jgi:Aldo/keto reductase family
MFPKGTAWGTCFVHVVLRREQISLRGGKSFLKCSVLHIPAISEEDQDQCPNLLQPAMITAPVVLLLMVSLFKVQGSRSSMSRTRSYVAKGFSNMKMMATPEMDYINLGSSDLSVSKVCLGTMTWGQQNTMAEGIEQLDVAFKEYGINFLDTAEMYPVPTKPETQGETDRVIAKWLKGRDRSKVIIASKVSGASERITWLPGRNGNGARVSKKDIMVSVEESLKRLGTDYIDLVQIHWPDRYVPLFGGAAYDQSLEREFYSFEEQLRAFDDLIKQGKVRHGTRISDIS